MALHLSFVPSTSAPNQMSVRYPFLLWTLGPTPKNSYIGSHANIRIQDPNILRRSANYKPSIWNDGFLQSLRSDYLDKRFMQHAEKLKEDVRNRFNEATQPIARLELIDTLQRLGLDYHFKNEIKTSIETILSIKEINEWSFKDDLHNTALYFRLLRHNGYEVSQDVFKNFKDEMGGDFKAYISEDIKGMLSLYEASYHAVEGEHILDEAQEFTTKHMKKTKGITASHIANQVGHSLEIPLHWRMPRIEARWFIDWYDKKDNKDFLLVELAKLDFNIVQVKHQQDLKDASRWWRCLGLGETLKFTRDRLVENFFWAAGFTFEPQFGLCRRNLTKVNSLITTIDDIYDVYGTLDELKLFTDAIERWDINTMQNLPNYMKICFLALFNFANEMGYNILKEQGWDITPYLKKVWTDLCKAYLVEANWYHNGYTPTLEEYMNNGWISISGPTALMHGYFLFGEKITKEALESLQDYPNLVRWSSMAFRFLDDLGTSKDELERGDVPKSIQCYMHENKVSEKIARAHIKHLIHKTWKNMNKDRLACSPFPPPFVNMAINIVRTSQCIYQYGDGYGVPDRETKEQVLSLLIDPIPLVGGLV